MFELLALCYKPWLAAPTHPPTDQQWTWRDQDVLRTTRAGSTAGCLAYGTPCLPKGSRSGRHISRDVLELDAWRALSNPAAVLYLLLRDDYRRASGAGVGLERLERAHGLLRRGDVLRFLPGICGLDGPRRRRRRGRHGGPLGSVLAKR